MLGHLKGIQDILFNLSNSQAVMWEEMDKRFTELSDKIETIGKLTNENSKLRLEVTALTEVIKLLQEEKTFVWSEPMERETPSLVKLADEVREKYRDSDPGVVRLANDAIETLMENEDMASWMQKCNLCDECRDLFLSDQGKDDY